LPLDLSSILYANRVAGCGFWAHLHPVAEPIGYSALHEAAASLADMARGDGRIPRGEAEAGENLPDCVRRWINSRKYAHARAPAGTGENIKFEYAGH
jgi:hypothetical protein